MTSADFALFEFSISRRGRTWRWSVSDQCGNLLLAGNERSRPGAQYMAARAIFQFLLTAPYRNRRDLRQRRRRPPIHTNVRMHFDPRY
ncbi:hypothetical protein CWO91_39715 [Bradyrhizobium genosp. SA-3]|nr:hypothetical protein CWO91_39715 [Bradyrhizobium genosp. SA-3]